ncbi:MAG: epimerase [Mycobacterium sp.]
MKIVLAGGSGSLGRRIADDLGPRGHEIVVLTRRPNPDLTVRQVHWDGQTVGEWAAELEGPGTAVINLAGKLVDCRPTKRNIAELTSSRVLATRALVDASRQLNTPVAHWIQASTTAIWSDAGETRCTESTPLPAVGLPQMTGVARPWEEAFSGANTQHGTILRTSIVLDPQSPALRRLATLTKFGLGGRVGPGQQWFSWIHLSDWLAIMRAGLGLTAGIELPSGLVVAATDHPVRNAELMAALRAQLHRPGLPTPAFMLRVGAIALRTDPELGLTGRHATSKRLGQANFQFQYPTLQAALVDLL